MFTRALPVLHHTTARQLSRAASTYITTTYSLQSEDFLNLMDTHHLLHHPIEVVETDQVGVRLPLLATSEKTVSDQRRFQHVCQRDHESPRSSQDQQTADFIDLKWNLGILFPVERFLDLSAAMVRWQHNLTCIIACMPDLKSGRSGQTDAGSRTLELPRTRTDRSSSSRSRTRTDDQHRPSPLTKRRCALQRY